MDIRFVFGLYVLLTIVSVSCGIDKLTGVSVRMRPPAWVFGVVWPVLYLCLWYSSVLDSSRDWMYSVLFFMLFMWPLVYGCQGRKRMGVYVLLLSLFWNVVMLVSTSHIQSRLYLVPSAVWLMFALLLNILEVEKLQQCAQK